MELAVGSAPSTKEIFSGTSNCPLVVPLIKQESGMVILDVPLFVRKNLIHRSSLLCILQLRQSISKYGAGG